MAIVQMIPTKSGMRIQPRMPAAAYRTFAVHSPVATHFRDATCREVECQQFARGWHTTLRVVADPVHAKMADWIRLHSGRSFTYTENGGVVVFQFPPGQKCFRPHKVPVGRPELYIVRDGDWRGNPRGTDPRRHKRPEDFVDEFANNLDKLATAIGQG